MAACTIVKSRQSPDFNNITPLIGDSCCINCELLKVKLEEISSELSSAHEIIKVLQEERSPSPRDSEQKRTPQHNLKDASKPVDDLHSKLMIPKPQRSARVRINRTLDHSVFPLSENRYRVLRTLSMQQKHDVLSSQINKISPPKHNNCNRCKTHKIIICGDSHAKKLRSGDKSFIGKTSNMIGYVKPGAKLQNITNNINMEVQKLSKKDVIVIWGGANDIAKNESMKGLTQLANFVSQMNHTNILLVTAPIRYDLVTSSCVNEEVIKFNRKMTKMMKVYDYVKVIDSVKQRQFYTRHGLRLNGRGKEDMALRITKQINNFFSINNTSSVPLDWLNADSMYPKENSGITGNQTNSRTSGRIRKHPSTRSDDFLWIGVTSTIN